jgi:hypothetical protein
MTMRNSLLLSAMLLLTGPAFAQGQSAPARVDARERIPPALIGIWKLAPTESKFAPGKTPKAQVRIFSYTADAMLLVDYLTTGANGVQSAGNWTSALDGVERPEYMRVFGATPYAMVSFTIKDAYTFDLKASKAGKVFETGQFVLAQDGKTLTFTYEAGGTTTTAVYHPWNLVD